jgi:hypothetical protein
LKLGEFNLRTSKKTSCDGCVALTAKSGCSLGYNLEQYKSSTSDDDMLYYPLEECPKPMKIDELNVAKKTMMK